MELVRDLGVVDCVEPRDAKFTRAFEIKLSVSSGLINNRVWIDPVREVWVGRYINAPVKMYIPVKLGLKKWER